MAQMVPRFGRAVLVGLLVAVALAWSACTEPAAPDSALRTVILVSLDGTRPDDVTPAVMPSLAALARRGASAERLVPVFPTNTFPNHVSLVTGVSPARHGIVNNVFLDPERGLFRYDNDPSWIEVEPLWSIADRHGLAAASYHWIGSEGSWRSGHGPRHWRAFDPDTPEQEKVEQILAWLAAQDASARPRLVTTWFHGADAAAHRFGPGTPETRRVLRKQDRAIARLVDGLEQRGALATTIVAVVSDHGMARVSDQVDLQEALAAAGIEARVFGAGGVATVSIAGGGDAAVRAAATARQLGLEVLRPGAAKAPYPTGNPRFGDLVVLAPLGTALAGRGGAPMRGAHGYPPEEPSMAGLFIAAGGGIEPGVRLGAVDTLDVAPTVLTWLGIDPPASMEGRPVAALRTAIEDAPRPTGEDER